MKKVILIAGFASLILGACSTAKFATNNDDVYASPSDDKRERERIAAEQKKAQEEADRKKAEEIAAQKAKDDANPAYKSPDYNKDDYYDYEYAARLKRFGGYNGGLGYYDNWYTNSYYYNYNPYSYGVSIYSSYNYWGPSNYYYGGYHPYGSYSMGYMNGYNQGYMNGMFGYSPYGYGYNPYGGYGYNPYGYNPYWGYNPYAYGGYGYNPYYGYGSGWGYFNQFDVNSGYKAPTYAPRGSQDGGNGLRMSNPNKSADSYASKYIQGVNAAQEVAPKFSEPRHVSNNSGGVNINNGGNSDLNTTNPGRPINGGNNSNQNSNNNDFNTFNPKNQNNNNADLNSNNPKGNINTNTNNQPVEFTPHHNNNPTKGNIDYPAQDVSPRNNNNPKNDNSDLPKFNDGPTKTQTPSNPPPINSSPRSFGNSGGNGGFGGGNGGGNGGGGAVTRPR